ncbi:MAG: NADH-quinone oxidoreductase subunit N [Pirellulales bacterium]
MNPLMSLDTVWLLLPEIVLVATATLVFVGGAFINSRVGFHLVALASVLVAAGLLFRQEVVLGMFEPGAVHGHSGPILIDYFGHALRWLALLTGGLFLLLSSRAGPDDLATEVTGSLLLAVAGLMLVCISGDIVLLFAGLELISIPTYILLYLGRDNAASQEATTKYFFLSILSSALLLYGFSFLYGISGTTELAAVRQAVVDVNIASRSGLAALAPLAMVLMLAGLGFRIAAVPFHFYAPDVYQGTTNGNAGLLAVVPKIAGIVALIRLIVAAMPGVESVAWQLVLAVAVLTMTLGNVTALWQQNIRRMMAYSSIAHAGYMFIGLAVALAVAARGGDSPAADGVAAALFYLVVYVLATTGVFAVLVYLSSRARQIDGVDDLAGIGQTHPLTAICLAIFMFSLTGLPPLAGFWGKLSLFLGALAVDVQPPSTGLRPWFVSLAVIGALNAAISAGYYLRVVGVMYFRSPVNVPRAEGGRGAWLTAAVAAVLVVAVGLVSEPVFSTARRASSSLHNPAVLEMEANSALPRSDDRTVPPALTQAIPAEPAPR